MSLTPYTERQKALIVNNVVQAANDITKLNRTGYKFINLCSGFIAHYNLYGFKAHYSDYNFKRDILQSANANKWNNFRPGEKDYEYYMSKKDIYAQIVKKLVDNDNNI